MREKSRDFLKAVAAKVRVSNRHFAALLTRAAVGISRCE